MEGLGWRACGESIVLLHGFGGTRRAWDGVLDALDAPERYLPLALDLPGHGRRRDGEPPITFAGCVEHVLGGRPERFVLCGYSMGGRVALQVALAAPERVARLVLVSTTAGIEDPAERARRRAADRAARRASSRRIRSRTSSSAGARSRCSPRTRRGGRAGARRSSPQPARRPGRACCAASARGEMEPLWDRLGELTMPVTVLVGERDEKFRALGERMAEPLPRRPSSWSLPGGHDLPLESPAALATGARCACSQGLERARRRARPRPVGRSCPPAPAAGPRGPRTARAWPARRAASGPREASAAAAWTAAATPSGPSRVEAR